MKPKFTKKQIEILDEILGLMVEHDLSIDDIEGWMNINNLVFAKKNK